MVNAQTSNPCGHSICGHCSEELKKKGNKTCHKCRQQRIGFCRNIFAEQLLEKIKVKCNGCSEQVAVNDVAVHVRQCTEVEIECDLCKHTMKRSEEERHQETCPKGEVKCKCGLKLKREEEELHKETMCNMTKVPCPLGCELMVERYGGNRNLSVFCLNLLFLRYSCAELKQRF